MIAELHRVCEVCQQPKLLTEYRWKPPSGHYRTCKACIEAAASAPREGKFRCTSCRLWKPLDTKPPTNNGYCTICVERVRRKNIASKARRALEGRTRLSRHTVDGMAREEALKTYEHEEARRIMSRVWGRAFTKNEFIRLMTCPQTEFIKLCPEMQHQALSQGRRCTSVTAA